MPTFPQLTGSDQVSAGDLFAVYIQNNGDARKVPVSVVQAFMQENLNFQTEEFDTQYASPSSTGFSVSILSDSGNVHLILTPTGGFAAGTIVLPAVATLVDKQEFLLNCTQAVATLTVTGSGATVTGAPTTLAANAFFRLKYDLPTNVWFRVG